jgi:hypothetical protein
MKPASAKEGIMPRLVHCRHEALGIFPLCECVPCLAVKLERYHTLPYSSSRVRLLFAGK